MLELYQFESCPFCAKVRQVMTELQLDYICRNVPKGSQKRDIVSHLGGQDMVPFLVDLDKGIKMYESDDIIAYLREHYG